MVCSFVFIVVKQTKQKQNKKMGELFHVLATEKNCNLKPDHLLKLQLVFQQPSDQGTCLSGILFLKNYKCTVHLLLASVVHSL